MEGGILDDNVTIVFEVINSQRVPCKETISYANVTGPFHENPYLITV